MEYILKPQQRALLDSFSSGSARILWFTKLMKQKRELHRGFYPSYTSEAKAIIERISANAELQELVEEIRWISKHEELTFSERCKLKLELIEKEDSIFNAMLESGEMDFSDGTSSFSFAGWGPNGERDLYEFEPTTTPNPLEDSAYRELNSIKYNSRVAQWIRDVTHHESQMGYADGETDEEIAVRVNKSLAPVIEDESFILLDEKIIAADEDAKLTWVERKRLIAEFIEEQCLIFDRALKRGVICQIVLR